MDENTARGLVERAAEAFWREDAKSLPCDVNERTVTHRLAVYLERKVRESRLLAQDGLRSREVHVDCEYNRCGLKPKRIHALAEKVERNLGGGRWACDTEGRTVYPDIVVHRRGEAGPNLIAIEVKRRDARLEAVDWDEEKLRLYQEPPLSYQHAFLVLYGNSARPEVQRFPPAHPADHAARAPSSSLCTDRTAGPPALSASEEEAREIRCNYAFIGSRDFLLAYELLGQHSVSPLVSANRAPDPCQSWVTCAAMALELALKCRIFLDGRDPPVGRYGHDYEKLFSKYLSEAAQLDVASSVRLATRGRVAVTVTELMTVLRGFKGTFQQWRYLHEQFYYAMRSGPCVVAYFNGSDMKDVIEGVHASILQMRPDWHPWPSVVQDKRG